MSVVPGIHVLCPSDDFCLLCSSRRFDVSLWRSEILDNKCFTCLYREIKKWRICWIWTLWYTNTHTHTLTWPSAARLFSCRSSMTLEVTLRMPQFAGPSCLHPPSSSSHWWHPRTLSSRSTGVSYRSSLDQSPVRNRIKYKGKTSRSS